MYLCLRQIVMAWLIVIKTLPPDLAGQPPVWGSARSGLKLST